MSFVVEVRIAKAAVGLSFLIIREFWVVAL